MTDRGDSIDRNDLQPDACDGCALVGRRDFLRETGGRALAALLLAGATPAFARALPVEFIAGASGEGEEKKYPMPAKDGTQIDKDAGTIITRWEGKIYVFALSCPHQNTAIRWYDKDHAFECPKHHSRYLPDGEYVKDSGRATRGLDRFAVRRDGATIVVNLDALYQEDDNGAEWKSAFVTV